MNHIIFTVYLSGSGILCTRFLYIKIYCRFPHIGAIFEKNGKNINMMYRNCGDFFVFHIHSLGNFRSIGHMDNYISFYCGEHIRKENRSGLLLTLLMCF